jgi:hypothetical protein
MRASSTMDASALTNTPALNARNGDVLLLLPAAKPPALDARLLDNWLCAGEGAAELPDRAFAYAASTSCAKASSSNAGPATSGALRSPC